MPFNKIDKMLDKQDEGEDSNYSAPSEDLDTEQEPGIDNKASSLGLNTLKPSPLLPKPSGYDKKIVSPESDPEDVAYHDQEAKGLKDKMYSVVGEPSIADKINALMGGMDTAQEQQDRLVNMGTAGIGTVNTGKNAAQLIKEMQMARETAKQTGTKLSPYGEVLMPQSFDKLKKLINK